MSLDAQKRRLCSSDNPSVLSEAFIFWRATRKRWAPEKLSQKSRLLLREWKMCIPGEDRNWCPIVHHPKMWVPKQKKEISFFLNCISTHVAPTHWPTRVSFSKWKFAIFSLSFQLTGFHFYSSIAPTSRWTKKKLWFCLAVHSSFFRERPTSVSDAAWCVNGAARFRSLWSHRNFLLSTIPCLETLDAETNGSWRTLCTEMTHSLSTRTALHVQQQSAAPFTDQHVTQNRSM